MTWEQALEVLNEGKRIRYKTWWWGNFLEMKGGRIYDDKKDCFSKDEIETCKRYVGWEEYDEEKHGKHNEKKESVRA